MLPASHAQNPYNKNERSYKEREERQNARERKSQGSRNFHPKDLDLKLYFGFVDKIVQSQGAKLTNEESEQACVEIKGAKTYEQVIAKALKVAIPENGTHSKKKINSNIYCTLLEHERCPWEIKKYLFSRISYDTKDVRVYHSYLFAADRANDFETIKQAFKEIKVRKLTDLKTYSIFIKTIARQGYLEEAREAFREAKELNMLDSRVYNSFLNVIGRNGEFQEVQSIFDEARNAGYLDLNTYNSYIHLAGQHGKFAQAKAAFLELRDQWKADAFTYTSFMNAAGLQKEFQDVKEAFEEAKQYNFVDARTYNSYIDIAGKNRNFEEALKAFQEAKRLKLADRITYLNFIFAAGYRKKIDEAQETFDEAKKIFPGDFEMYDCFIKVTGQNQAYNKAREAFNEAKNLKLARTSTFEIFIFVAGENKKFSEAKEAFEQAKALMIAGVATYTRFIDAAGTCGEFRESRNAFDEIRKLGLLDQIAVSRFIQAAGNNKEINSIEEAFAEAKKLKIADKIVIADFIEAAGNNGRFVSAKKAFEEAKKNGNCDKHVYNTYISIAGKNNQWQEALQAFEETKKLKIINDVTYNIIIDLAGKSKQFSLAKQTFQESKKLNLDTPTTYASFISGAGINGQIKDAKEAFQDALNRKFYDPMIFNCYIYSTGSNHDLQSMQTAFEDAKKLKIADAFTYSLYIDIIGSHGQLEKAKEAFEEAKKLGYYDVFIFTGYMDVLRRHGKEEEARQLFGEVKKLGIADSRAYNSYINSNPTDLNLAYEEAKAKGFIGTEVFNSFMSLAGKKGNFAEAKIGYQDARKFKVANTVTFTSYIDIAGKHGEFDEATMAFEDSLKLNCFDVNVYNSYMNIAEKNNNFKLVSKLFDETRKVNIADVITYTTFIVAATKEGKYQESKKAFEDARKLKVVDECIYKVYLAAAINENDIEEAKKIFDEAKSLGIASPAMYAIYIRLAGKKADKLRLQNPKSAGSSPLTPKEESLSFKEVQNVFLEAKALGHINLDIYGQFINAAGKFKEFQAADAVLSEMESSNLTTAITRNVLTSWKIKASNSPTVPIQVPSGSQSQNTYRLISPFYRLLLRLNIRGHQTRISQEKVNVASNNPLPETLLSKLDENLVLIPKNGELPVQMKLRNLLKAFANEALKQKSSVEYARLTGGAVAWCLTPKFYEDALERIWSNSQEPFLDAEHRSLFEQLCKDRFAKPPKDWDFKFLLRSTDPQQILDVSDALPREIALTTSLPNNNIKAFFFHKQCFTNKDGNMYSLRRVVDEQGTAYEFAVGGMYARPNLFSSDALQIPLDRAIFRKSKKSTAPIADDGLEDQSAADYALKRLRANSPETINEYGCSTYIARRSQGYYGIDQNLEINVCRTFLSITPDEIIKLLVHARDNHCENKPEDGLTMLFHICSTLCDAGYFLEAEELSSASEPLWAPGSKEPFFKALLDIWIKEKCSFVEVRTALEVLGLAYLMSSIDKEPSNVICRIDEHNGKQVIELAVNGKYFSVPLAPSNTFKALSLVANLPHTNSIKKLIKALSPENGFHFDQKLSKMVAEFLGISISNFEELTNNWLYCNEITLPTNQIGHINIVPPPLLQPQSTPQAAPAVEILREVNLERQPAEQPRGYLRSLWNWMNYWMS